MIYEDLLVPCLEDNGWEVLAGKRRTPDAGILRPVVYVPDRARGLTFDYILRRHQKNYLAEAKAWPVFEGRTPKTAEREYLHRHLPAFFAFRLNEDPCYIGGRSAAREPIHLDGKLLLWWKVTPRQTQDWRAEGLEVLSIEDLLKAGRRLPEFRDMVGRYRGWVTELFDSLEAGWD